MLFMNTTKATAPGKIILFGEHSVVYGQPAIAVPVSQVQATCTVRENPAGAGILLIAPDIDRREYLSAAGDGDPLALAVRRTLDALGAGAPPLEITITSTIPIACGLGSGAAISAAIIRALGAFFRHPFDPQQVSDIAFEVEKIYHGTPSGIDNTVVAFAQPIFFVKGQPIERLTVGAPLTFIIGDTGIKSPTYKVVGDLRARRSENPAVYDSTFARMGALAQEARSAIERGDAAAVGRLMGENHAILRELGISHPLLDALVSAAMDAGALGAKLSGAGWGGNMIALATPATANAIGAALTAAGAVRVIETVVR